MLDRDGVEQYVYLTAGGQGRAGYVVMGIVDLEAKKEGKEGRTFDGDTLPGQLVQFTNLGRRKGARASGAIRINRGGRKKRKKKP